MTTGKKLLNSPETAVVDALKGLALTYGHLQRLEGSPQIKVVINRNHDKSKVAVISGGGHEPAHAGYVGEGMLAAAVCGDIFASPSTEAVLAAIRAVTGPPGCLLIVKNYTGDRLNFGLAIEQALSEGLLVELVVVGDDVAIDSPSPLTGRRGLAGTVLVHKAAGAAASRGLSLREVADVAVRVAAGIATLGVGLTVCTLPGKATSDRLGPDEVELGLGIHGEPGRTKEYPPPAAGDLVRRMLVQLTRGPFFRLRAEGPRVVLLVNNLGATTPLEMSVVTGEALTMLRREYGATVNRLYVGPYMTSLDMAGVSFTLLSYDLDDGQSPNGWDELLELLDAPTTAPGWVTTGAAGEGAAAPPPPPPPPPRPGEVLGRALRAAAEALMVVAPELDEMDSRVGDGDCGTTVAAAAAALLRELPEGGGEGGIAAYAPAVAKCVRNAVGGSSGALYDILLTAAARHLKVGVCVRAYVCMCSSSPMYDVSPKDWLGALSAGLAAVQKYGRADVGCRTMLDALLPARDALATSLESGADAAAAAAAAASAAAAGAEATRGMAATAGRASYVPAEVLAEVADPGARAVAVWLGAVAESLRP
ncbi:hypothetical protein VOLCADRAFT_62675 [Volvox carteri f. nagariensis]|uniref:Dihydroxyacetone kinase n=1 Tax=Volvox carteri f. nagariensis TaxID=3068 RepID=D8U1P2_VOLCA|nr:uncharacterized protein VOLCADRAFT_62675 [Volvox carteri f. nagariensis]EFJ46445.1 hypothetical protein VOLCADRAFT_62675 [Volvox carteri f. nagariensis]|eukprot:XP_002952598.1 hypothetical protein VOLCADRAFT_62675 [Volvox carteri f. nagariensis]